MLLCFLFWESPGVGTRFIPILDENTGGYSALIPKELHRMDEASLDQELLKRGIHLWWMTRSVICSIAEPVPVYFQFWPSKESGLLSNLPGSQALVCYGLSCCMASSYPSSGALGRYPVWWLRRLLAPDVVFIYTSIHLLSWALIRYRLPVDAVLVIFAGMAVIDLANRLLRSGKQTQLPTTGHRFPECPVPLNLRAIL